jgi:hypothetical protein
MMYFGESWGAPICNGIAQAPTPVGCPCGWCKEAIVDGDQGLLIPGFDGSFDPSKSRQEYKAIMTPFHRECNLRQIIGSLAHQQKRCSCYGGTDEDEPGMTLRESAKAAANFFENGM